jgi:hypothetical protein
MEADDPGKFQLPLAQNRAALHAKGGRHCGLMEETQGI